MKKVIVSGIPDELLPWEEIAKEQSIIKIRTDRRRYGKIVTIVEGFDPSVDLHDMAKMLKKKMATGGSVKDGQIVLQGEHTERVKKVLEDMGYTVEIL